MAPNKHAMSYDRSTMVRHPLRLPCAPNRAIIDSSLVFIATARASIEEEYSKKLLSLCRKPLGSQEMGSLKNSLDTVRGELESMGKQHQSNAAQMRSELEEPLAAFAGAMKERRKIVQNGIEKLLKLKIQQTQHVNKVRTGRRRWLPLIQ